jgi:hypothetical protein
MDDSSQVKHVAQEMIERFGATAVCFVREQAEIAEGLSDLSSAKTWYDIADAIEQLWPKPCRLGAQSAGSDARNLLSSDT